MKSKIKITLALFLVSIFSVPAMSGQLKPRMVVLTDITTNDIEPDDMESMIRLFAHADLFEVEALVATTGWSNTGGGEHIELIHKAIDAYEKDLPNLLKRSEQSGHLSDESRQEIGYWPSVEYLRSRTVMGSTKMGQKFIGADNDSVGSNMIIKLADEDDNRPLWVTVWGGGNTVAQSIWRVQQDRSPEQLKEYLHKLRIYTITDQDRPWGAGEGTAFSISSHQWLRKEFADDLFFIWDECAWLFQNSTGVNNWAEYEKHIQGHGNLGALYPKYKWGVEGDTPSFLYIMPVGLSDPEVPGQGGWGGYFTRGTGPDKITTAYTNQKGTDTFDISTKYQKHFYPAIFNNFAARMDWAKDGKGNRNPVVAVNGIDDLNAIITIASQPGSTVTLDGTKSTDPDGDELSFLWWILPEAGDYKGEIKLTDNKTSKLNFALPEDSAGESFHIICEVTDNGTPALTSYRRIIVMVSHR